MRRIVIFSMLVASTWSVSASASSPDAWQALYDKTEDACLQKSGLKNPKKVAGPVVFSHSILYRIKGAWPQRQMKGKSGSVYCLHPFPDGEPEIAENLNLR